MNIAWVIVVLLLIIVVQGMIYNKWGLKGITYKREFKQKTVFQGEVVEMVDQIANRKLLPIPWIRLESKISRYLANTSDQKENQEIEEVFHRTLFSLLPYQKITRRHQLTATKRGYYPLDTVSVTTGDAIGFSESFDSIEAATAVTVYPSIIPVDEIPLPSHSWLGDITVKRWIIEDPFLHAGVREYQAGDPLNSINWKATARSQTMQINKKDYTADHHLMIYVNFDTNEDIRLPIEKPELMETALSYAASLAAYTLERGVATGFGCNGYFVEPFTNTLERIKPSVRTEPSNSGSQLDYILDTIAKVKMDRSRNFRAFLEEDLEQGMSDTDIIIFTSQLSERVEIKIRQLEQLGNAVEVVLLNQLTKEAGEEYAS
ncbi:Protein of unknown function DUF58 [Gracilibacillus ureilyticus]|uniref:DUF58 domain-containing protein n=1 Tax=Gracilibacillus ureilyticus TaxID=531814 RepID=A0A1H9SAR3_9BACI|nr:DUF58 domain-containing protein [Gracilibacillus ureilyticus]SER81463.1 Protein of unknown function DUF58 [Gracilibacillus ureilyticus]